MGFLRRPQNLKKSSSYFWQECSIIKTLPYVCHHIPFLIRDRFWIITIHKARILTKKKTLEKPFWYFQKVSKKCANHDKSKAPQTQLKQSHQKSTLLPKVLSALWNASLFPAFLTKKASENTLYRCSYFSFKVDKI